MTAGCRLRNGQILYRMFVFVTMDFKAISIQYIDLKRSWILYKIKVSLVSKVCVYICLFKKY